MRKMLRIGIVDLDTSHPKSFTEILNHFDGVKVTAVWDGHDVYSSGYEEEFARENGIESVCRHLEDMVELVDAALVLGANWDKHIDRARPFIEARKPVLIDKPLVGRIRDVHRLLELESQHKSVIYGGSSLRFAEEITGLKEKSSELGQITSAIASGPGDFFSYGIHTVEMAQGFLGAGCEKVEYLGKNKSSLFKLTYENGLILLIQLETLGHEWSLCVYSETGAHIVKVDQDRLYRPFLENFVKLVRQEKIFFSLAGALEAIKILIAARMSQQSGGVVSLNSLDIEEGFDGSAFSSAYALAKKKKTKPH
jgi:predicted dehydrogenase